MRPRPTTEIRITIRLPHSRCFANSDAIVRVAELAEELGFWGVSVEDHFLMTTRPCNGDDAADGRTVYETLNTLAFVAARTQTVKLITGVLVLPYRHPVMLAKETMTIDALSGGRLILGVGVGALRGRLTAENVNLSGNAEIATREFDAMGVYGDRGPLADEYLAALIALWTQNRASFTGRYVSFEGLDMFPRPLQVPIPVWVGGRSEKALRRAARHDGWFPSQCSVELMGEGRGRVEAFAAEQGLTPPADYGPCNEACVLADGEEARRMMRKLYGYYFVSEEALWAQTVTGAPEEVAQRIVAYRDAGATFVDLRLLAISVEAILEQMRLVAGEVVPALA